MKIRKFTVENCGHGCVTDEKNPRFSFAAESDVNGARLESAVLSVGDWKTETCEQIAVPYGGKPLEPFTRYDAKVQAVLSSGESAESVLSFETGDRKSVV